MDLGSSQNYAEESLWLRRAPGKCEIRIWNKNEKKTCLICIKLGGINWRKNFKKSWKLVCATLYTQKKAKTLLSKHVLLEAAIDPSDVQISVLWKIKERRTSECSDQGSTMGFKIACTSVFFARRWLIEKLGVKKDSFYKPIKYIRREKNSDAGINPYHEVDDYSQVYGLILESFRH